MRMWVCLSRILCSTALLCFTLSESGCSGRREQILSYQHSIHKRVRIEHARLELVQPVLETFGTLVYHSKADVYPGIDGTVEEVSVEEGQRVWKGQTLAVFSKDKLLATREQIMAEFSSKQALETLAEEKLRVGRNTVEARFIEIQKAETELAQAQAEFDNVSQIYSNKKRLFEAGGIAEGELQALHTRYIAAQMELTRAEKELEIRRIGFRDRDILAAGFDVPSGDRRRWEILAEINTGMLVAELRVAEADLEAARAELRRIDMMLSETVLQAPIDGIVGMRFVEVGEKANRDTLLFTLFNTDSVYAQIEVAETDLRHLRVEQEAELVFEEQVQQKAIGRVELISPYINPKTRTARVRVSMDNPHGVYIPGMFARIRIFTGKAEEQVTVPFQAVMTYTEAVAAGDAVIFIVRNSRLFRRVVSLGQREGNRIVVMEGLEAGEAVVLDASVDLRDGTEVEVVR